VDLLILGGLAKSKREARQLIEQGGVLIGDEKAADINHTVSKEDIKGGLVIKKGKKAFMKFVFKA
jgi:tyrosyl-tRNA synthetase